MADTNRLDPVLENEVSSSNALSSSMNASVIDREDQIRGVSFSEVQ